MVSPAHKRQFALERVSMGLCSGRAMCRILGLARSTYRYRGRPVPEHQQQLMKRMSTLSAQYPRYGYRRIAALLRQEGWRAGKRMIQRLRRQQGLRVPPTRHKRVRRGLSTGLPRQATHRGHVWSWDFIADSTVRGGALRMITILDEYTRECHVLRADRALKARDVLEWLQRAIREQGAPEYLRSDNGPEFIAKEVQQWLALHRIRTIYIDPGSPWQNGFVESFHGRFRDECLNREQLWTLTEARVVIEDYRCQYNQRRPHSRLGYLSPAHFAARHAHLGGHVPLDDGQNQNNKLT